jgi:hypothetical protein
MTVSTRMHASIITPLTTHEHIAKLSPVTHSSTKHVMMCRNSVVQQWEYTPSMLKCSSLGFSLQLSPSSATMFNCSSRAADTTAISCKPPSSACKPQSLKEPSPKPSAKASRENQRACCISFCNDTQTAALLASVFIYAASAVCAVAS